MQLQNMLNHLNHRNAQRMLCCGLTALIPCLVARDADAADNPPTAPPALRVANKQPDLAPIELNGAADASSKDTDVKAGPIAPPAAIPSKATPNTATKNANVNSKNSRTPAARIPLTDKPAVTNNSNNTPANPTANNPPAAPPNEVIDQFITENWDPRSAGSKQLPRRNTATHSPQYVVPSPSKNDVTSKERTPSAPANQPGDDGFTSRDTATKPVAPKPVGDTTKPNADTNATGSGIPTKDMTSDVKSDWSKQKQTYGSLDWVKPDAVANQPNKSEPKQAVPPVTKREPQTIEPRENAATTVKPGNATPPKQNPAPAFVGEEELVEAPAPKVNRFSPSSRPTKPVTIPKDRDPGDDSNEPERSAPAEISSDDMEEVVIESDDGSEFKQRMEKLPPLSVPSEKGSMTPTKPEATPLVLRADVAKLRAPIAECLKYYYRRPEDMAKRSPWGTFHSVLPFGLDGKVVAGGRTYNGLAWLCSNNPCRGQRILTTTREGQIKALEGIGLQGHQAQFLAILGQSGVPIDYPLYVKGRKFTVADLVKVEQANCRPGAELTFTLIGLSAYLPTDTRWRASDGSVWDFERVLAEEMKQPVVGAACGGTHRMMGFSYSLRQRRLENLPVTGQWDFATTYVEDFFEYGWAQQNPDGSFSTNWFEGRADNGEIDRKLQTSGHILEWLVFTSPREQLQDDRTVRAVKFILNALTRDRNHSFEVGPKGHALRALALYYARVFEESRPWATVSEQASRGTRVR